MPADGFLNSAISTLENEIESYNTKYQGSYMSPEMMDALLKTFTSKNITLEEWNTVVTSLKSTTETSPDIHASLNTILSCIKQLKSYIEEVDARIQAVRTEVYARLDTMSKNFILSYNDTLTSVKADITNNNAGVVDVYGRNITQDVIDGYWDEYDDGGEGTFVNTLFNTQDDEVDISNGPTFVVFIIRQYESYTNNMVYQFVKIEQGDYIGFFRPGDFITILEDDDIPDRWLCGNMNFHRISAGE